uniref:HAT C-terminal dimerisation domain-containing protein n=1 Tax=Latimeria chalumnae TaxID=7897 RepID=H3AAK9_LATCH
LSKAERGKGQRKKESELRDKQPILRYFLTPANQAKNNTLSQGEFHDEPNSPDELEDTALPLLESEGHSSRENEDDSATVQLQNVTSDLCYSNDPGMWPEKISDFERQNIVKCCQRSQVDLMKLKISIPADSDSRSFPEYLLYSKSSNGQEKTKRDWLTWSKSKGALLCVPCLLFSNELEWRNLQQSLQSKGIDSQIQKQIPSEAEKQRALLERLLDATLFLASRNMALRGSSSKISDAHSGNFLGVLELISHYDPFLHDHLAKVKESQEKGEKMHAYYLSWESQNEFIELCVCDATPDTSHRQQNMLILRYVHKDKDTGNWKIYKRFIEFFDLAKKNGQEIVEMLLQRLQKRSYPSKNPTCYVLSVHLSFSESLWSVCRTIMPQHSDIFWMSLKSIIKSNKLSNEALLEAKGLKSYFKSFTAIVLATLKKLASPVCRGLNSGKFNFKSKINRQRKRKRFHDESPDEATSESAEAIFQNTVFYVAMDNIINKLNRRFQSVRDICDDFAPVLKFKNMNADEIITSCDKLANKYSQDLTSGLASEVQHLKKIYSATFQNYLRLLDLLNAIYKRKLETIFGEICITIRIFCTLPVTVAEGKRAFSKFSIIKNYLRSTMSQDHLSSLAILS